MQNETLERLVEARRQRRQTALVTELSSGRQCLHSEGEAHGVLAIAGPLSVAVQRALARDTGETVDIAGERYFIQVFNPPKRMIVVGAVHITQALVPMARLVGYDVLVVDPRGAWATKDRFPDVAIDRRWPDEALAALAPDGRTAVVTLTHDPKLDDPALGVAIRSRAFYVGALGGRKTREKRRERLQDSGFSAAEISRIHGPVGLDIGAVSPAEIALSILAEVTSVLHRGSEALAA